MSKYILPVVIVAVLLSCFRLGFVTLFDVDEAVFSTATKEMVQSGNWMTPTYNGENRYDKPILFYWLMAASYKAFGINNFAARLPSAIAAICLALALFLFVRHFRGEKPALYAALSLTLSLYFAVYSRSAVTDMSLTLFISASLFCFYLSLHKTGTVPFFLYGFYFFSALAFLTKGLIGIVFPFGVALIYLFATEGKSGIKKIFSLKGTAIFLLLSIPWYAAQVCVNGQEFIDQFFIKHHFKRYAGVISGHSGPLYYYIPVILAGLFPWVAFLPSGIRSVFREKDRLDLFAFIWAAFVVIFFSFSTTKLPNYILPAMPAAVILIASGMNAGVRNVNRFTFVFMALLAAALGCGLILARSYLISHGIQESGWMVFAASVIAAVILVDFLAIITKKSLYPALYCLMALFLVVMLMKAVPVAGEFFQGTLYRYSLYAKEKLPSNERIIAYGINNPSIVFYSGHKIVRAGSESDLKALAGSGRHSLLIAKTKDSREIEACGFNVVSRDEKYALFEKK